MADEPRLLIQAACKALFAPSQVAELRILAIGRRAGHTASGWFSDYDALADAALRYESQRSPEGLYVTLNPVHEACLARSPNATKEWVKTTTSDKDILRRHWLPIDIDPARPAGVSSTDAELAAAREVARAVVAWLESEFGFPPGVRACSGNGIHLLYRIDLPNDDDGKKTVAACLAALSAKFTTDQVKVDTSNINAARIWKLYGTLARKGEAIEGRPHRRSCLLNTNGAIPAFGDIQVIPADRLEALAGLGRPSLPTATPARPRRQKKKTASKPPVSDGFAGSEYAVDLDGFIAEHNIPVVREESFDTTGKRYILDACLFDSSHTGTSACLGRSNSGKVFYRCFHDSCSDKDWSAVKALFGKPALNGSKTTTKSATDEVSIESEDPWELAKAMLADELSDADTGQVLVRRHRETFYLYTRRRHCYRAVDDDGVKVRALRWLGGRVTKASRGLRDDVVAGLAAITTLPSDIDPPFVSRIDPESVAVTVDPQRRQWMALRNGILDLDAVLTGAPLDQCLHAHSSEWFSVSALSFAFPLTDDQAACPRWLAFLAEIFDGDQERVDLLQELFGMAFLPSTEFERFAVFHGAGRNGKSTCLKVLRLLVGPENVAALSLEQIADKTMIEQLQFAMVNICADMNEVDRVAEGILKAIVSGETLTFDRKYKSAVRFRPYCKLFFACNVLPRFADTTLGIWRRMVMLPFDRVVDEADMDIYLLNKLEVELPGIFVWALQGLARLKANGAFTVSSRAHRAVAEYKKRCFPVLLFLEEATELGGHTTARVLWSAYRKWVNEIGLTKPKALHAFLADVQGFVPSIEMGRPNPARNDGFCDIYGLSVKEGIPADLLQESVAADAL